MLKEQDKEKLKKYSELKIKAKELESEIDELNKEVLEIMILEAVEEIQVSDLGKLILGSRRTWQYTKEVEKEEKALKELKKLQERTGAATYTEKFFPIFKTEL